MTLDLSAMLAEMTASTPAPRPLTADDISRQRRASADLACRTRKRAEHAQVLADCGGDREKLKEITVWVPRKRTERMFFRAFIRESATFRDMEVETESTEYTLETIEVERAQHPKDEQGFARLQGRYVEKHECQGHARFHSEPLVKYAAHLSSYAPLGDFEWADRDEEVARMQALVHKRNAALAARPIRNIRESRA